MRIYNFQNKHTIIINNLNKTLNYNVNSYIDKGKKKTKIKY